MTTPSNVPFSPADSAGRWTKSLLVATLVLSVAGMVSGLFQIDLLSRATTGAISDAEAAANDSRQQLIGILRVLVNLGTIVAFLVWFRRTHQNLPALGVRGLKYSPGWAVGGFFVPFLNLVRPLQVMREVWHGSDPAGLERDEAPNGRAARDQLGTPSLVVGWWSLFLITGFLGNTTARMAFAPDKSIEQLQVLSGLLVLSDLLEVPSVLVTLRLVGRITRWQTERADLVRQRATMALPGHAGG